jgi:hypothetical protein
MHASTISHSRPVAAHNPSFNTTVPCDIPLLDGYPWEEIANRGSGDESFLRPLQSRSRKLIRRGKFSAVLCHLTYICASFWISYLACRRTSTAFIFGTDASSLIPRSGAKWKLRKPIGQPCFP